MSRKNNRKEVRIANLLEQNNIPFERQTTVSFNCIDETKSRAFTDFTLYSEKCLIALEIDQFQHKSTNYSVSCDLKRMLDVRAAMIAAGNFQPILWIRYNPDAHSINGVTRRIPAKRREAELVKVIKSAQSGDLFNSEFGIVYMYYDMDDGKPTIFQDEEYHQEMKSFVLAI